MKRTVHIDSYDLGAGEKRVVAPATLVPFFFFTEKYKTCSSSRRLRSLDEFYISLGVNNSGHAGRVKCKKPGVELKIN